MKPGGLWAISLQAAPDPSRTLDGLHSTFPTADNLWASIALRVGGPNRAEVDKLILAASVFSLPHRQGLTNGRYAALSRADAGSTGRTGLPASRSASMRTYPHHRECQAAP